MTKRLAEILVLSLFTVIAVALYQSTAAYPEITQGSTGAYIRFLALALGALCLLELGVVIRTAPGEAPDELNITSAPGRFMSLLVLMFFYAVLLEPLGFYVASGLFLPITMFIFGARTWPAVLCTGGVLLFVFLVFAQLLGVPLPESSLF